MKLELRKEEKVNGDVFYNIFRDDRYVRGFYEAPEERNSTAISTPAENKARAFYEQLKDNSRPFEDIVTILETAEIHIHETENS